MRPEARDGGSSGIDEPSKSKEGTSMKFAKISVLSVMVSGLALCLPGAHAQQQSLSELVAKIPTNTLAKEQYTQIIRQAQGMEETLIDEEENLEGQLDYFRSFTGPFLIRTGDGYTSVDDAFVEQTAAAITLHLSLGGDKDEVLPSGTQFNDAVNASFYYEPETTLDSPSVIYRLVREALRAVTQENYEEIDRKIPRLQAELENHRRARERLAELVEMAVELRDRAPSMAGQGGVLQGEGYYVMQRDGSGLIKGYAGIATRATGYDRFVAWVDEGATEVTREYYWTFPTYSDATEQFAIWQEEADDVSEAACARPPALGPSSGAPAIWTDGPSYSIVAGPVERAVAFELAGSSRVSNNEDGSSSHWEHTSATVADVEAVCGRY